MSYMPSDELTKMLDEDEIADESQAIYEALDTLFRGQAAAIIADACLRILADTIIADAFSEERIPEITDNAIEALRIYVTRAREERFAPASHPVAQR